MWNDARKTITPQLVFGIVLVAIGVLLLLERVVQVDVVSSSLRYWPIGLVAVGGVLLATREDHQGRWWGYAWVVLGAWMLLRTTGLVRISIWQLFWPLVLIAIGWRFVSQTLRAQRAAPDDGSGGSSLVAVMAESKQTFDSAPFRRASMTGVMGGCVLDLRRAVIAPGEEAAIEVFGLMSGHEIVVPGHWVVDSRIMPIMGSVEDKRLLPVSPAPAGAGTGGVPVVPRLILHGVIIMSGLTIKT